MPSVSILDEVKQRNNETMEINITTHQNDVELKITGRLDTIASAELNKAIEPYLQAGDVHMLMNCTEMNYISSSGLRILLSLHKALHEGGGSLVINGVQPAVMQILQMTGFSTFLNIQ